MSTPEYFRSHECGKQFTALELPDIVHMQLRGKCTLEECEALNQHNGEYGQEVDYFFYIIDLAELEDLPPAVRRSASEAVKGFPVRGTVILNAPLKARVLAKLLLTAANLFRRGAEVNPVVFADTEEEARAWIEKRRQQLAAAVAAA